MFGTLAAWRAYMTARGDIAPADASDLEATAALVRASDYIRLRYVANLLPGYGADHTPPGHELPLTDEAAYIAASLELTTPGFFSATYTPDQRKVLTRVEGIAWTPVSAEHGAYGAMPVSTTIEALFRPYVSDGSASAVAFMAVGGARG